MAPKSDGAYRLECRANTSGLSNADQTIYEDDRVKLEKQAETLLRGGRYTHIVLSRWMEDHWEEALEYY